MLLFRPLAGGSTPLLEPPLIILWLLVEEKKIFHEWLWTSSNFCKLYINNKWREFNMPKHLNFFFLPLVFHSHNSQNSNKHQQENVVLLMGIGNGKTAE